jgi:hypothetical protein
MDYLGGKKREFIGVKSSLGEEDRLWVKQFFRKYSEMPEVERVALSHCRGKILDAGAGGGAHSLYLNSKGFHCYPIDVSEGAVRAMKLQGLSEARNIDFFDLEGEKFDTILLLMNGIGITGKLNRLSEFFIKAKELLNPDGRILLDSSDIMYMYQTEEGDYEWDPEKYHGEVRYRMSYKGIAGKPFDWLFVDFPTVKKYAENEGFDCRLVSKQANFSFACLCQLPG